jgi:protease-4
MFEFNEKLKNIVLILIMFFIASYLLSFLFDGADSFDGNVAVIKIRGVLTVDRESGFKTDYSSSSDIVETLKQIEANPNVKAIILDINSPGGSPVGSDEIGQALKKSSKYKVAVIHEVGASGAYWIATACDVIFANRMSITGSIGVTASYLDFSGLINRYNVSYEKISSGKYKDLGSPLKPLNDEERAIFNRTIMKIHEYFVDEVSINRKMPREDVEKLATGQFYLGIEAKELGLIDELGNLDDAKSYVSKKLNASVQTVTYSTEKGLLSELLSGINTNSFSSFLHSNKNNGMTNGIKVVS